MVGWHQDLARFISNFEEEFDELKAQLGARLGERDPLMITPYLGYGTSERVYLKGRVLENEGMRSALTEDTLWDNLVNMYRRFASDEIPGARVRAQFGEQTNEVVTDEEGFFDLWIETSWALAEERLWHEIDLTLLEPVRQEKRVTSTGRVLVPPPGARIGVISDIDDTVVHTDATSLLKMARIVFLGNAHTRLPFPGVAAFYRALQGGRNGDEQNPLFYVSSSPWNLFDLLLDFLVLQEIPLGPLMLRDWGLTETEILPTGHSDHKLASIRQILDLYPHLPFVLIGDSGQEDPEIYGQIVKEYPERIRAIYIRNVSLDNVARPEAIRNLAKDVRQTGSELLLVDDTLMAARHAVEQGWIDGAVLEAIAGDAAEDQGAPSDEDLDIVEEKKDRSTLEKRGQAEATDLVADEGDRL
jgi:phosphatidate phosphatase APP1